MNPAPGLPAETPIELLFASGGLYFYSSHCCDNADPHTGMLITTGLVDESELGCPEAGSFENLPALENPFGAYEGPFGCPFGLYFKDVGQQVPGELLTTERVNPRRFDDAAFEFGDSVPPLIAERLSGKVFEHRYVRYGHLGTKSSQPFGLQFHLFSNPKAGEPTRKIEVLSAAKESDENVWNDTLLFNIQYEGTNQTAVVLASGLFAK